MNAAARSLRPNFIGMNSEELRDLVDFYQQRFEEQAVLDGFVPIIVADYLGPYCPIGYDTVLGYLAKNDPLTLSFMEQTPEETEPDDIWLKRECDRLNMRYVEVPSCPWLARQGVFTSLSFPVAILSKRLQL
jgi:hypothetical protein